MTQTQTLEIQTKHLPFDCPALGWKMSSLGRSCKTSNVNFGTAGNLQNASESTLESIDVPKGDGSCFDELGLYEETNPSYQGKSHPSKISWPSFCLAKKLVAATKQAPPEHGENTEKTKMSWNHAIHLRYGFKQLPGLKRKIRIQHPRPFLKNAFWQALPWRSIAFPLAWMADQTSRHTSRG